MKATEEKPAAKSVSGLLTTVLLLTAVCLVGIFLVRLDSQIPTVANTSQINADRRNKLVASIAAVGDIACKPGMEVSATQCQMPAVAKSIEAGGHNAVLLLGDLQYDGGEPENFASVFTPLWQTLKEKSYAAPGNHEYVTKNAEGYFGYWNGSASSSKQAGDRGKGYYSFDLGSWHAVALNSNCKEVSGCDKNSEQGKWLAADLNTHKNRCTLAFWHHPHFSSGRYKGGGFTPDFWDLLYSAHADVVLNGHDHLYERFAKQTPGGKPDPVYGIRQFTVGTGGKTLYEFKDTLLENHQTGSDDKFGYLTLQLYQSGYSWSYKTISEEELDKGSSSCSN